MNLKINKKLKNMNDDSDRDQNRKTDVDGWIDR